jgi:hypothetical protein
MHSRNAHIDPHQPVIGAREREDADQGKQRIVGCRPEDGRVNDLHDPSGEHIVRSEITRRRIHEISRVERRITLVGQVGATLQRRLLRSAIARRGQLGIDTRMLEQLLDGTGDAVTIQRIGVLVARDHEQRARLESAVTPVVIINVTASAPRADVIRPKADLVEITRTVTVLRSVKDRRCRMAHQEVDLLVADGDRDIPVALR